MIFNDIPISIFNDGALDGNRDRIIDFLIDLRRQLEGEQRDSTSSNIETARVRDRGGGQQISAPAAPPEASMPVTSREHIDTPP